MVELASKVRITRAVHAAEDREEADRRAEIRSSTQDCCGRMVQGWPERAEKFFKGMNFFGSVLRTQSELETLYLHGY